LPLPLAPPRTPPRLSIVVLPFINLSNDLDQQYLADGITEDLTTELSRIPEMFVISRRTAFTYRNTPIHTKQIGRQLGVRYVLEGTVRRSANRVRITTQLVDAESDLPLWVERYDRNVTEFLDLQSEIATAILGAIEPELLKFERVRIARRPQQNEDAYELYQRGMWHHYRNTRADNVEAQSYFRRALAIDAQYPHAAAALTIAVLNAG